MKTIIAILLLSSVAFAEPCETSSSGEVVTGQLEINTDLPKHLVGAKITVTLADGSSSTVPAEKFKVVPRKQQFITTKTTEKSVMTCTKNVKSDKRHIISAGAGVGMVAGLEKSKSPTVMEVETKTGPVFGLQYQYQNFLDTGLVLGIQGQTNGTGMGILGVEF